MEEIWVDIVGYESIYQISSLGRVKSLERTEKHWRGGISKVTEKIIKHFSSGIYPRVNLCKNGFAKPYSIHRLLGEHFIPNPNNYTNVLHSNDVKTDFRLENLRWGNQSDNVKDKFKNGYKNSDKQRAISSKNCVLRNSKIVLNTQTGIFYDSVKDAAYAIGVKHQTLANSLSGRIENNTQLLYA